MYIDLTNREIEVLYLMCLTNEEIAQRLFIDKKTVKRHIHNIIKKFGCKNRTSVLVKAIKMGLINPVKVVIDE